MNYLDYRNAFLAHHGILGQKWGVRNGPPYPLDADDHSTREKKAGWKKSLKKINKSITNGLVSSKSEQYQRDLGLSKKEADKEARETIETAKKIALAAGIVLGVSASVYAARKYGMTYCDRVLSAGTTFQTLSNREGRMTAGQQFYAAYKESDKRVYEGLFGQEVNLDLTVNSKFKNVAEATSEIKIASPASCKKVFETLLQDDPEFKQAVDKLDLPAHEIFNFAINPSKSTYDSFNRIAPLLAIKDNESANQALSKFYSMLSDKGYSGIVDVNDRFYSGFNADAVIIFDKSNLDIKDVYEKVSNSDVAAGKRQFAARMIGEALTKPSGVALAGYGAYAGYDYKRSEQIRNGRKKKEAKS